MKVYTPGVPNQDRKLTFAYQSLKFTPQKAFKTLHRIGVSEVQRKVRIDAVDPQLRPKSGKTHFEVKKIFVNKSGMSSKNRQQFNDVRKVP